MLKRHSNAFGGVFAGWEVLLLALSAVLAFQVRAFLKYGDFNEVAVAFFFERYLPWLLSYGTLWFIIAVKQGLYSSHRTQPLTEEIFELAKAQSLALVGSLLVDLFFVSKDLDRTFVALVWLSNVISLATDRFAVRVFLRSVRRRGYNLRRVLVVGTNTRARNVATRLLEHREFGIRIAGFLDNRPIQAVRVLGKRIPVIGSLAEIRDVLRSTVIDEVYVVLPLKSMYSDIEAIVATCEEAGVRVRVQSNLFNLKIARHSTGFVDDIPFIDLASGPDQHGELLLKRGIDIVAASILLFLLSPLLLLVALIIKLTSSGPVIFSQVRLGYNSRPFAMHKFRSMVVDAEQRLEGLMAENEVSGPVFKMKCDPRVTPIGRFIRMTSIDELPQLWNVLLGHMSLVGPRPPIPSEVDRYDWWQRRRLSMRPGITCFWQVSGRSGVSFDQWIALDLKYIDNWSLKQDLVILLRTIPAVLRARGAH